MRARWSILALVALLVAGTVSAAIGLRPPSAEPQPTGMDHAAHHDAHAGAHDAHASSSDEADDPLFAPHVPLRDPTATAIPDANDAPALPLQFQNVRVTGDKGFEDLVKEGYLVGHGTADDPYVMEGYRVRDTLEVRDTTKALVIRGSLVEGQLKLNYNGDLVHVHHNRVRDLRVNENVERHAPTTGGLFEHNAIAVIGQLRHFGGEFASNDIGPRPEGAIADALGDAGAESIPADRVWNFDGYHLAWAHDNDVLGRVDVKLHGHYHGSCASCGAHNHAEEEEHDAHGMEVDHTERWHTLTFERNSIRVTQGDGLRFYDRAHAGDDRTANSEPDEHLELAHAHHTLLRVLSNRVEGGPLRFDVVDAEDERHHDHDQAATVELEGNDVRLPLARRTLVAPAPVAAYEVDRALGLLLLADHNRFAFEESTSALPKGQRDLLEPAAESAAFAFRTAEGRAVIQGTQGEGARYGVALAQAPLDIELHDNAFHAQEDVHHG
jgi:hypothetical protein